MVSLRSPGTNQLGTDSVGREGAQIVDAYLVAKAAWRRAGLCLQLVWGWESDAGNFCTRNSLDVVMISPRFLYLKVFTVNQHTQD